MERMDVDEPVQNDYIATVKKSVRHLPEYDGYVAAIASKDANKIASATTSLIAAAQVKILQQIKDDTLAEGDMPWMASTIHYAGYSADLRQHYNSQALEKVLKEDDWKMQLSVENTIATCIAQSSNSWQVWISTLLAVARINNKEEYNATFLYLGDRYKIAEEIINTPFTSAKSWTTACLDKITQSLEDKPVHFTLRIPTSMEKNPAVLHESIVLREMRDASQFNTLVPYCYGVFSCPGSPSYTDGKVVSTCIPKANMLEAYSIEQRIEGATLADSLPTMNQKDFDSLMVIIASTLNFLYQTYGFVHSNLTASSIILEGMKKSHTVRYMDGTGRQYEVTLPFRPRMTGYTYSQTHRIPWVSRYSLPGQSPVADVRTLYKSIVAVKRHKLNMNRLNEILAMIDNAVPAAVVAIPLWVNKSKTLEFFNIYDYVLEQYEEYPGRVVEERIDTLLHLPSYSEDIPVEALSEELAHLTRLLSVIDKRREVYSHIAELSVLRDWIALRVVEDRLLVEGVPIQFHRLPIYTDAEGEPFLYDSNDRLLIPEEYAEYDEAGRPIVYLNGEATPYTDHVTPKIALAPKTTPIAKAAPETVVIEESDQPSDEDSEEVIILNKKTDVDSGSVSEEEFELPEEETTEEEDEE